MTDDSNRALGTVSFVLAAMNSVLLVLSVTWFLCLRPTFLELFQQFGTELPLITRIVFGVPVPAIVIGAVVLLVLLVAKELIPMKVFPLSFNLMWIVAATGLSAFVYLSHMIPMVALLQRRY